MAKITSSNINAMVATRVPGVTISANVEDKINNVVDHIMGKLFPKDSILTWAGVVTRAGQLNNNELDSMIQAVSAIDTDELPRNTHLKAAVMNRMIRAYAGKAKVPEDLKMEVAVLLELIVTGIVVQAANAAVARGSNKVSLKDVNDVLRGHGLAPLLSGGLRKRLSSPRKARSKSRSKKSKSRSGRKKKSKSRSTKHCGRGKSPVHSFKRSTGRFVKAYCRKSK